VTTIPNCFLSQTKQGNEMIILKGFNKLCKVFSDYEVGAFINEQRVKIAPITGKMIKGGLGYLWRKKLPPQEAHNCNLKFSICLCIFSYRYHKTGGS
jgi:hypothetical protein